MLTEHAPTLRPLSLFSLKLVKEELYIIFLTDHALSLGPLSLFSFKLVKEELMYFSTRTHPYIEASESV